MPYDDRPTNEGGNKGIDVDFSRNAPKGKHRIVGVDTFDGGDWVVGDYDTYLEAVGVANEKGGQMTMMHVYNEDGKCVHSAGTF